MVSIIMIGTTFILAKIKNFYHRTIPMVITFTDYAYYVQELAKMLTPTFGIKKMAITLFHDEHRVHFAWGEKNFIDLLFSFPRFPLWIDCSSSRWTFLPWVLGQFAPRRQAASFGWSLLLGGVNTQTGSIYQIHPSLSTMVVMTICSRWVNNPFLFMTLIVNLALFMVQTFDVKTSSTISSIGSL